MFGESDRGSFYALVKAEQSGLLGKLGVADQRSVQAGFQSITPNINESQFVAENI